MDAVAPALIGIGIYLAYEAWTNAEPHPIQKLITALKPGTPNAPGQIGYGAAVGPVNQTTGVAGG